jgi:hypothetical protein
MILILGGNVFKFVLPVLLLTSAVSVYGTPTPAVSSCGSGTLASYDSSFAFPSLGCSIGILDYSNFSYVSLSNAPSASSIEITPGSDGFGFTQVGGAPFTASGDVVKFAIYYNIFIDPAPVIGDSRLSLDPPMGDVSITEFFCNDSTLYSGATSCFPPTSPAYTLTVTTQKPTGSIIFGSPALVSQQVGIVFTLDGTKGVASFDGLDTGTDVTSITPEPASVCLVGFFLLAAGYKLRKQRQN